MSTSSWSTMLVGQQQEHVTHEESKSVETISMVETHSRY